MFEQIIDVHCHPLTKTYIDLITSGDEPALAHRFLPPWSVELQLEMMEQNGIGATIFSQPSLNELLVGREGAAKARAVNEALAALVTAHPNRFGAFGVVPMDNMDAANAEMAYALDVLKLDGIGVTTHCNGIYLGEHFYDPWFEEMNRRGVTLFVHPAAPAYFDAEKSTMNVAVLEFMFDTTRMVTTMVLSGAKQKYDRINIISTHGGGTIPYLAHRISTIQLMPWAFKGGTPQSPAAALAALGSFYFDLTASSVAASVDPLRKLATAERILMGFDYALMPVSTVAPAIAALMENPALDDSDKHNILRGNGLRLFPRFA